MTQPLAGKCPEVARVPRERLLAVGDRAPVVAGQVSRGGPLVPPLREVRGLRDDLGEQGQRAVEPPALHGLDAAAQEGIDRRASGLAPEVPQDGLGAGRRLGVGAAQGGQGLLLGHGPYCASGRPDREWGDARRHLLPRAAPRYRRPANSSRIGVEEDSERRIAVPNSWLSPRDRARRRVGPEAHRAASRPSATGRRWRPARARPSRAGGGLDSSKPAGLEAGPVLPHLAIGRSLRLPHSAHERSYAATRSYPRRRRTK